MQKQMTKLTNGAFIYQKAPLYCYSSVNRSCKISFANFWDLPMLQFNLHQVYVGI